jgi:hypothetical protein
MLATESEEYSRTEEVWIIAAIIATAKAKTEETGYIDLQSSEKSPQMRAASGTWVVKLLLSIYVLQADEGWRPSGRCKWKLVTTQDCDGVSGCLNSYAQSGRLGRTNSSPRRLLGKLVPGALGKGRVQLGVLHYRLKDKPLCRSVAYFER